ncbi:SPOR domain-containing protein [Pseudorhodoplanes sp.]|uniref:SPOR domain-containing protein n=1 Tax=Pseudorhodoplanes sp. TaxID=1934341 RepID=UPI002BC387E6|nr:SPOR domain-containing protein [Pseudorhodoplanes sp.]HWV54854.1 SPOR domain-containing protein [Pseudorhodoplanes sp.]
MAENDRTRGHRDNETYRRPRPQPAQSAADPLQELARLIGQQNESAPSYRQNGAPTPYGDAHDAGQHWAAPDPYAPQDGGQGSAPRWHQPSFADDHSSSYGHGQHDQRYDAPEAEYGSYPSGYGEQGATPYGDGPYADPRYADPRYSDQQDPRYGDQQYAADPRHNDPRYGDPRYGDSRYSDQHYDRGAPQGYADPRYAEPNFGTPSYGASGYAPQSDGYAQHGSDPRYQGYGQHAPAPGYGDAYYGAPPIPAAVAAASDDRVPAKRRGNIVTVLAVLALAVVGTASAFGYRAMFVGSGSPVPAPVIKADPRPSKVVPATDASNKPIQDRIGVKTEKIVPRQEEPVQQAAPGQPRVIAPFLAGQNPQAFPPASANIAPATSGSATQQSTAAGEPKRIRTVPIKPPGAETPGPRSSRATQPEEASAGSNGAGPLALAPTGSVPPAARQAARQAHAALPQNEAVPSAFPTPLPAAPSASRAPASGPFAVQVTSQRSEADAQSSYRSLQQQFPSVLGNRQPVIRRADLGERGTYYRAQIPFQSQNEASEFCSSLKAAGGQCVVAKN